MQETQARFPGSGKGQTATRIRGRADTLARLLCVTLNANSRKAGGSKDQRPHVQVSPRSRAATKRLREERSQRHRAQDSKKSPVPPTPAGACLNHIHGNRSSDHGAPWGPRGAIIPEAQGSASVMEARMGASESPKAQGTKGTRSLGPLALSALGP